MLGLDDCSGGGGPEWRFRLFGATVRVKLWFWVLVVLLCGEREPAELGIWVAVCFVSILLHEFGHVFAFRLFGEEAEVVLYGWGGLAIPGGGLTATLPRFVVSLAGPMAGFCLAGLTLGAAGYSGGGIHWGFHMLLPSLSAYPAGPGSNYYWYVLLNDLLWVNFYWGLVNLLPVYPLDGGQAARVVFEQRDPYRGRRNSLILSAVVAAVVALHGLVQQSMFRVMMFGVLAAASIQAIGAERPRMVARPYRSSR